MWETPGRPHNLCAAPVIRQREASVEGVPLRPDLIPELIKALEGVQP